VPGVWFFSLDAANSLAVWGARTLYSLPYFNATMRLNPTANTIDYSSVRSDRQTYLQFFAAEAAGFPADFGRSQFHEPPPARFAASWQIHEPLPLSQPGDVEFFLTERYCLYSYDDGRLFRSRIFHDRWPLQAASVRSCESTMIESLGVAQPEGEPLLHYAESIAVDIWPLHVVSEARP
jgi:uncharacterized protein YqjF (DUF2071 family)